MEIRISRMTCFIPSPLIESIRKYFQENESEKIYLYVPYIKTRSLEELLDKIQSQITIITTWHINDLVSGSSELKLYRFCKENNITLYIHNKIHLKVYSVNLESAVVASGNISHNGLMEGGNYEAGVLVDKLEISDRMYLEKIKREATFVDDDVYQIYLEAYENAKNQVPEQIDFDDPKIIPQKDYFLKSALPMTENISELIQGYNKINSNSKPSQNSETANCIYHDLANYEISTGLSEKEFRENLKNQFFSHPFTKKIEEFIDSNERTQFGFIKRWVRDHCTDVPLPRPWEFTKNIQILYHWFIELGDGEYEIYRYGEHTESIRKTTN
jgi:hypothetical protein